LTFGGAPDSFRTVFAARRIVAVVLLSLWLPATLHCAVEAAGVYLEFVCHDHETQAVSENHCADDSCHAIEGASFTVFSLTKLVGIAALSVVALLAEPLEFPPDGVRPERTDVPRELQRSWQFSTRAAPPARAPSVTA
jgi:hypothetical protein